ncbi:MAG TPA: alkaline phosphatase family protein [Chloroflexota bacterium]
MAVAQVRRTLRALIVVAVACATTATVLIGGPRAESAVLAPASARHSDTSKSSPPGPFALVLVIDAARYDQMDLSRMPNLATVVAGGTQYANAWVGQLPSITETSHATIGTGMLPSHHLILGDTWRVPGKDQMSPDLLSGTLDRTGYIGKFIHATGSPSLASMVHAKYPGSIVVSISGHKVYAADAMGAGSADFIAFGMTDKRQHFVPGAIPGHVPAKSILDSPQLDLTSYPRTHGLEDGWTTTLAEKFLFKYHPRLMMVNFPEVDVAGHVVGTNADVMQPLFANIDRQLARLIAAYGRAGMLSRTYIIITSDHAMVPGVHNVSSIQIQNVITGAGGQILYQGHGDYTPIWLKNPTSIPRVAAALSAANVPNVDAVYARGPTGAYTLISSATRLAHAAVTQSYADLLGSFTSAEAPDIVLFYDENTITMTPNFLKIGRKGDHGGGTWGSQHIPLIVKGPNIKQDYTSQYPARLVDIAPTVETLLGIQPQRQDGVPLADAMTNPPLWAVESQGKQTERLSADVESLRLEAVSRPNVR